VPLEAVVGTAGSCAPQGASLGTLRYNGSAVIAAEHTEPLFLGDSFFAVGQVPGQPSLVIFAPSALIRHSDSCQYWNFCLETPCLDYIKSDLNRKAVILNPMKVLETFALRSYGGVSLEAIVRKDLVASSWEKQKSLLLFGQSCSIV